MFRQITTRYKVNKYEFLLLRIIRMNVLILLVSYVRIKMKYSFKVNISFKIDQYILKLILMLK